MKALLKPALMAGLALALLPQPAMAAKDKGAPAATGGAIKGVGIVNLPAVIANSNAFKTAEQQRPVTYKAQIDQAESRRQQISNQLKPLVDKFETDRKAAKPNEASLQQQAVAIQQIEQNGQREIQNILQPVALSRAYVEEQVTDQLDEAISRAAAKSGVSLVMTPDSVLFADPSYNLNQAVLTELNALLPNAQLVPPQGWLPRSMREQQEAAQAAQQQAAPAARPDSGR